MTPQHGFLSIRPLNSNIVADDSTIKEIVKEEMRRLGNDADLNHINTSKVTSFESLFDTLDFCGDVSEWDVHNVRVFSNMFFACRKFDCDLSKWETESATNMTWMFGYCENFQGAGVEKFIVDKVFDFSQMFINCKRLTCKVDSWNPIKMKYADEMFKGCELFDCDLSRWNCELLEKGENMFLKTKIENNKKKWPKAVLML